MGVVKVSVLSTIKCCTEMFSIHKLDTGILNVPARIMDLRNKHHIPIILTRISAVNKFGRSINYGSWSILNKKDLYDKYIIVNK